VSTPTAEARAAAMKACTSSIYGGYETVQAVVDAVWPLAVAQGRQEAVAEIVAAAYGHSQPITITTTGTWTPAQPGQTPGQLAPGEGDVAEEPT